MKSIDDKEQKGKRLKKSEQRLWETLKPVNICFMGVPEGEERKGQREYLK